MKYCTYCGAPNVDGNMICPNCGMTIQAEAPQQVNPQMYYQVPPQTNPQVYYQMPPQTNPQVYYQVPPQTNPQVYYQGQQQVNQQMYYQSPPQVNYQTPSNQAPKKKVPVVPIIIGMVALIVIGVIVAILLAGKEKKEEELSPSEKKNYMSKDVSSCKTIKTSVEVAMGNEDLYVLMTTDATVITIIPGQKYEDLQDLTYQKASAFMKFTGGAAADSFDYEFHNDRTAEETRDILCREILQNIGETTPEIKYCYDAVTGEATDLVYYVHISEKGTVRVYIGKENLEQDILGQSSDELYESPNGEDGYYMICPELCDSYQQK